MAQQVALLPDSSKSPSPDPELGLLSVLLFSPCSPHAHVGFHWDLRFPPPSRNIMPVGLARINCVNVELRDAFYLLASHSGYFLASQTVYCSKLQIYHVTVQDKMFTECE